MDTAVALATLGLTEGASSTDITRAFRVLSRASHPDHGGDRGRFEAVLAAYRTLQRAGCARPVRVRRAEPTTGPATEPAAAPTVAPDAVIDVRPGRATPPAPAARRDPYRRLLDDLARAEATPYTRPRARRATGPVAPRAEAASLPSFASFLAAALRDRDDAA